MLWMASPWNSLVVLVVIVIVGGGVEGSLHDYKHATFRENGNAYLFYGGSEGMLASSDSSGSGTNNGKSYIRFENITLWRTKEAAEHHSSMEHNTGLIQAVIFEASDRDNIGGSAYGGRKSICCTPDLAKMEGCEQGEIIRRPSAGDSNWPKILNIEFRGDGISTIYPPTAVSIPKTGMYNLYFIFCDPSLKGLVLDGKTVWKNPTGYLPGRMAPLMTFYGVMSLAYLLLGLIWFSQYIRFWKDILQLQNCITLVIALGMFEMTLWYFEYANFNATGVRPMGITFWAVTFGAARKTIARILILVVSMGYGVVRPTLGGLTSKVILLGATYFLASEMLDVVEHVGTIDDLSGKARLFLVLPVAILDAFLILWVFTSLSRTLEKLQARKRLAKLEIYRKFTNALAVAVIVSVAWIGYELYFKASDPFSEHWQSAWIISAFWHILSFALLCVLCVLWAPSQNSMRYAYSEEAGEDFDEEEAVALTSASVADGDVKQEKKERKAVNTDVFSLDDGTEEDKRE
uniref:TSA: Wollemia nobilis Ref_Wollemi_Transcript_21881_2216 transcribed RNA sequence n=1 Tax=Wollemia nobilis TaxID=56998 RepID=A0A0C9S529_9CONI